MYKIVQRINLCLPPPKSYFFPFQFSKEENILGYSFESYQGFSFSYRESRKRMVNTLLMVQRINLCCLLIFILCKKKIKPGLYLQQADILALNPQRFCQKIVKKIPFGKMNCLICFFIGVAIKIAVSVSWCTTPVSLCQSNDLQLHKCSQKCCFGFCGFGFEGLLLVYVVYLWKFDTKSILSLRQ